MAPKDEKDWKILSSRHQKAYKRYLDKANPGLAIPLLGDLHEEAFAKIDCLQCANCCKNYSPRFKTPDIRRIAKHLGKKEGTFIAEYLRLDEEGDYVVRSVPCPFLGKDNRCGIYEHRPSDCRRFPYTNEDVFIKRKQITLKNSTFCPIAVHVLEGLLALEK
jgi:Fe-S-cluster containining protein